MDQAEAKTGIANWETDLRAELLNWPKEEIIDLVVSLALKDSIRKMVMDTKLQPALKNEHANGRKLKQILKKRRSKG